MPPRGRPVEACALIGILKVDSCPCMAQHDHHLRVAALAGTKQGRVAVGVDGIEVGRVLQEELDAASMT